MCACVRSSRSQCGRRAARRLRREGQRARDELAARCTDKLEAVGVHVDVAKRVPVVERRLQRDVVDARLVRRVAAAVQVAGQHGDDSAAALRLQQRERLVGVVQQRASRGGRLVHRQMREHDDPVVARHGGADLLSKPRKLRLAEPAVERDVSQQPRVLDAGEEVDAALARYDRLVAGRVVPLQQLGGGTVDRERPWLLHRHGVCVEQHKGPSLARLPADRPQRRGCVSAGGVAPTFSDDRPCLRHLQPRAQARPVEVVQLVVADSVVNRSFTSAQRAAHAPECRLRLRAVEGQARAVSAGILPVDDVAEVENARRGRLAQRVPVLDGSARLLERASVLADLRAGKV
mmetsp:Transcript_35006/g.112925  ORF Transcript_35006/g.112925 Transcript_35006/m.112925 type:complete len:347 (-) Transcript_35006:186-1226(-)